MVAGLLSRSLMTPLCQVLVKLYNEIMCTALSARLKGNTPQLSGSQPMLSRMGMDGETRAY